MREYLKYKRKKGVSFCVLTVGLCGVAGVIVAHENTYAVSVPDVAISVGAPVGNQTLAPGKTEAGSAHYFVPIEIVTANSDSYSVYINGTPNLTSATGNTIKAVTADTTLDNMSNEWGYRYSYTGTNPGLTEPDAGVLKLFSAMPSSRTVLTELSNIDTSDTHGSDNYLTLAFGAKVDGSTVAETYTGNVTVSVVANPQKMTIFDIDYMQDMTHDICENTTTPKVTGADDTTYATNKTSSYDSSTKIWTVTKLDNVELHQGDDNYVPETTLIDRRDNKAYLVRKLADGHCWMSQNLELDFLGNSLVGQDDGEKQGFYSGSTATTAGLPESAPEGSIAYGGAEVSGIFRLTDEDTDLHSMTEWTPALAAQKYKITSGYFNTASGIVEATPENPIGIKVYATMTNTNQNQFSPDSTKRWEESSISLRSYSYEASDVGMSYSVISNPGDTTTTTSFSSSASGEPYERRGNLYNLLAATLGSKLTSLDTVSPDSICPRGWQLPVDYNDSSYTNLLSAYDYENPLAGASISVTDANRIAFAPLNIARAGEYYPTGYVRGAYADTSLWLNTPIAYQNGTPKIFMFGAYRTYLSTVSPGPMDEGLSIRCVAR